MRIGYVPCRDEGEAKRIAMLLLDRRLVACANIFPVTSIYAWQGKIVDEAEAILLVKTTARAWEDAKKAIEHEHSYECPCILCFDADANAAFDTWIRSNIGKAKVTSQ